MTRRVTDEQARNWARIPGSTGYPLAADLLDARAEVATLREQLAKVCEAATATQRAFEEQAECAACDDKAESMGGRVDPLCDVCMERWAVSHDDLDDAIAAARKP